LILEDNYSQVSIVIAHMFFSSPAPIARGANLGYVEHIKHGQ